MSELEIECALLVMRAQCAPMCATEMFLNFAADFLKAVREEEAKQGKEEK